MEEYSKFRQELGKVVDASKRSDLASESGEGKPSYVENEVVNDDVGWGDADRKEETSLSSVLMGIAPVLDGNFFGSDLLVAELQEASDAIEEMEGRVQVKLMVGEAVLRGLLNALEMDAEEAVKAKETELQKVKEQLKEKDTIVTRLINNLQSKEEELVKQVEESNCKERKLVSDMLTEREKVLRKVKESETFISTKEAELVKMAENMVELAMKLDGEIKSVKQLEKQLKESKEAEALKGREITAMMERSEQYKVETESTMEMVRREARLKELRLTDSLAEKDESLGDQLQTIENLKSAEQGLKDLLHRRSEEIARLVKSEKDSSELLMQLRNENKTATHDLIVKEGHLKTLQVDVGLLNERVRELVAEKSNLSDDICKHREQIKAKDDQILKQRGELQDADMSTQTASLVENHLQEEISRMNSNLQQYVDDASHSLKVEMEDQKWKYEFQTNILMQTFNGTLAGLANDINLLGGNSTENQNETVKFESQILQGKHAEVTNLRASKASLDLKLEDLNLRVEGSKQQIEEKDKLLEDKMERLRQAEETISNLQDMLVQKGLLIQKYEVEIQEITSHEKIIQMQQGDLQENTQLLKKAEAKVTYLEQELGVKGALLAKLNTEFEETCWRNEFEEKFVTMYVESFLQEFSRQIKEVQANLHYTGEKLAIYQKDVEATQAGIISKCKSEIESLKSKIAASAEFADKLHVEMHGYMTELSQTKGELVMARSDGEKEKMSAINNANKVICLKNELEALLLKSKDEVGDLLQKLEESEWKSHTQNVIILGLVEGATQERIQEFAQLREDLKVKHQEIQSLRSVVEEQSHQLTTYVDDVSGLKTAILSKDQELSRFRQETELTSFTQKVAHQQVESKLREAWKEIEDLKKLRMILVARIEEENQRVHQLEDALADQKLKSQFELDVVSTVLSEGGLEIAAAWNKERSDLVKEVAQLLHERKGWKSSGIMQPSDPVAQDTQHVLQSKSSPLKMQVDQLQGTFEMSPSKLESISNLERKNSELRREKEELLLEKTEEIYRIRREFHRDVEKMKQEWKSDKIARSLSRESSGLRNESERGKDSVNSEMLDSWIDKHEGNIKRGWDSEKSNLLESISQRDERIKEKDERIRDFSTKLSDALEKERRNDTSKASLVENLAALEKERNRLNLVHNREKEKLVAYYKKQVEEKDLELNKALKDLIERDEQVAELERESIFSKDEIVALKAELTKIRKELETDFAEQMQALVLSSQKLGADVDRRTKDYNLRLEGAQGLVKYLLRQFSMLALSETNYRQNVQNLQKAETEVDLLGDEVDALLDILEKVYTVLNHYFPIIQHYPGLAELVKIVKQEVLQRICDPKDA